MEINSQGRIVVSDRKWTADEILQEQRLADMYCRQADFVRRMQEHEHAEAKLLMDKIYQVRMCLSADGEIRKESSLGIASEGFLSKTQRDEVTSKLMQLIKDL
jgi:hypothetical protein